MSESPPRPRSLRWWCGTTVAIILSIITVTAILGAVCLQNRGWTYFYLGHRRQIVMAVNFEKITLATNGQKLLDADTVPLIAVTAIFPMGWWIHRAVQRLKRAPASGFDVITESSRGKRSERA